MELKREVRILGRHFEVKPRAKENLKGITIGEKLSYCFYDGNYIIEVRKYPVVSKIGDKNQWVDRLSLVLSLRDDDDPRVEKEVERIISEQKWTD